MSLNSSVYVNEYWMQFNPVAEHWHYAMVGLYSAIFAFSLPASLFVTVYYVQNIKIRKTYSFLIINLMVANLVFVVNLPLVIYNSFYGKWMFSKEACYYYGVCSFISSFVSRITMTMIGIERYLVVKYPYKRFESNRKTSICLIFISWLYGVALSALPFLTRHAYVLDGFRTSCDIDYMRQDTKTQMLLILLVVIGFIIPLCVTIIFYSLIVEHLINRKKYLKIKYEMYISAQKSKRSVRNLHKSESDQNKSYSAHVDRAKRFSLISNEMEMKSFDQVRRQTFTVQSDFTKLKTLTEIERKAIQPTTTADERRRQSVFSSDSHLVFNSFLIVFIFFLAGAIYFCIVLLAQFDPNRSAYITPNITLLSHFLVKLSFAVNPIIYALTNRECLKITKMKLSTIYRHYRQSRRSLEI
jgi:hypothetical protein